MTNEETTFYLEPKADPLDRIEVEVGDSKQPDFQPQVKMMRWDNEVNLSVRLIDHGEDFTPAIEGDRVVCEGDKIKIEQYQIEPNEEHPEGASEFEITLLEKPETNVIKFSINTKGLVFYYQPALTTEEKKAGAFRPENVVGSYAVYFAEEKLNFEGGKEYRSGKAFHWYRPRIEDAKGNKVWGELNIDAKAGIATVTIPQEFLDQATYPVKHAAGATFGYSSQGGSQSGNTGLSNVALFTKAAPGSNGTVTKITAYGGNGGSNSGIKGCIWTTAGVLIANGSAAAGTMTSPSPQWWDSSYGTSPTVVSGTDYYVGLVAENSIFLNYDTQSNQPVQAYFATTYASPGDISSNISNGTQKFSIYATYTALSTTITASTGSLTDFGSVNAGSNSSNQSFTVSGTDLVADLVVSAPNTNFQVSLSSGSGFGASVSLTPSGGTVSTTTIYVRFTPQSGGAKSGNVTASSTGATTQNVAVSGTGVAAGNAKFLPFVM